MRNKNTPRSWKSLLLQSARILGKSSVRIVLLLLILFALQALMHQTRDAIASQPLDQKQIESALKAKGKRVHFSESAAYEAERTIVRRVFERTYATTKSEDIGIALVDLNNDGKDDIIYAISSLDWCGSRGCPFGIVIHKGEKGWRGLLDMRQPGEISILSTQHNGYSDLRFDYGPGGTAGCMIARFDGASYSPFLDRSIERNEHTGTTIISTEIYDPRTWRWRFVDKR